MQNKRAYPQTVPKAQLSKKAIATAFLDIFFLYQQHPYLIFVTGTTGGACVKKFCQV